MKIKNKWRGINRSGKLDFSKLNNLIGETKKDIEAFAFSQAGENWLILFGMILRLVSEASKFEESETSRRFALYFTDDFELAIRLCRL